MTTRSANVSSGDMLVLGGSYTEPAIWQIIPLDVGRDIYDLCVLTLVKAGTIAIVVGVCNVIDSNVNDRELYLSLVRGRLCIIRPAEVTCVERRA